jgi:acetylornithine deacetylase
VQAQLDELGKEICHAVDRLADELVETAASLVQTRSVNPSYPDVEYSAEVGGEARCADFIGDFLEAAGLEIARVVRTNGRANLCARLRGAHSGNTLVLNGHVDTVTAGDADAWSMDPWSGEVRDGCVWGLGAADMKGPIASAMIAAKVLASVQQELCGEVVVQCVVGEESSEGNIGTLACLDAGFVGDGAICLEPTGDSNAGRAGQDGLAVAPVALGTLVLKLVVEGRAVHAGRRREVSLPGTADPPGVSALEKGLLLTSALTQLESQWSVSKVSPFYPTGQFTLNLGVVHSFAKGANSAFFIPDSFAAEYVIFYPPEEDASAVRAEIETCLLNAALDDLWLTTHPPSLEWLPSIPAANSGTNHALFHTVAKTFAAITGAEPLTKGLAAGCDAGWLTERGISTVIFGPGNLSHAHSPDEHVLIRDLIKAAKVYALTARAFCDRSDSFT